MATDTRTISLTVNGQPVVAEVEPRRLLVDFLREDLGLVGAHIGCEHGVCGTCTVLLNGASTHSCITLAVQADGADISTVEGLADGGELHPLQDEFSAKQGLQCGYCTPGMLMRAREILTRNPDPSPAEQELRVLDAADGLAHPAPLGGVVADRRGAGGGLICGGHGTTSLVARIRAAAASTASVMNW